ncbi:MAG: metal ABC transporter permease [Proteobacteria bacterium]|nr:metal ABC transporter permease [Pseudomonadota bacterium]
MYDFFIEPFIQYGFLKRALLSSLFLSISAGPLGVFLILRRLSLLGDSLSHGILPGLAIAFLLYGFNIPFLTIGGMIAGLLVACLSYWVSKTTILREDATLTVFYLISLALGVLILSLKGGQMGLLHLLFGSILAVDKASLWLNGLVSLISLVTLFVIFKPFVYDCFDPLFAKTVRIKGQVYQTVFLLLVVITLVAACQTVGAMMALGLMMIPAITARLICKRLTTMLFLSSFLGIVTSYSGLLFSYHFNLPSGPSIILWAGGVWLMVVLSKK